MEKIDHKLYDFSANGLCGVLMPKSVMMQIAKLGAKYSREMREVLEENKDKLFASDWTLANTTDESGKILRQTTIRYTTREQPWIDHRISLFGPAMPRDAGDVYVVDSRDEARRVAEQVHAQEGENGG